MGIRRGWVGGGIFRIKQSPIMNSVRNFRYMKTDFNAKDKWHYDISHLEWKTDFIIIPSWSGMDVCETTATRRVQRVISLSKQTDVMWRTTFYVQHGAIGNMVFCREKTWRKWRNLSPLIGRVTLINMKTIDLISDLKVYFVTLNGNDR